MAVIWGGFQPKIGAARLVAARWLSLGLVSLIPAMLTRSTMSEKLGSTTYLGDRGLSLGSIAFALHDPKMVLAGVGVAVALFVLFDQLLTTTTLRVVDPYNAPHPVRVWRSLWSDGFEYLPAFLRIVLISAALGAAGMGGFGFLFDKLSIAVQRSYATGLTQSVVLPTVQMLVIGGWLTVVGVWCLWSRVLLVADRRRVVRRSLWMAVRIFVRTPSALFLPLVVIGVVQLVGAPLLAWSWFPGGGFGRVLIWFVYLGLQVVCWFGIVHGMRRLYDRRAYDDLRIQPDAGFRIPSRLLSRLRRK